MLSRITKKEWLIVAILSLIIAIIVISPYLYGWLNTPKNMVFTGVTFDQDYSYFSMMDQAKEGKILFKNLYTSEDHKAVFFRPDYLFLGYFAKIFNLSNIFVFHLFKIIFIIIFLFLAYKFISIFFKESRERLICFLILCFSSGFGVVAKNIFGYLSSDLWIPESQTFASFFTQPHFILSQILILTSFILFLKSKLKFAALAGIANLILGLIHPFDLPITLAIPFFYTIIILIWRKENKILNYIIYASLTIPVILYQYLILKIEPIAEAWNRQNILLSPEILSWIIGYGLIFILAIFGFIKSVKNKNFLFINIWAIVNLIFLYAPVNFQRRMSEGLHIPLVILASYGVFIILNYLQKFKNQKNILGSIPKTIFILLILFSLPLTNINKIDNYFSHYFNDQKIPYYFSKDFYDATKWFSKNNINGQVILASLANGPFISGLTTNRVYLGFCFQTADYQKKQKRTNWFFSKNNDNYNRQKFLKDKNIKYILYGPEERKLGNFNPENKKYLKCIFRNNTYFIYKVL